MRIELLRIERQLEWCRAWSIANPIPPKPPKKIQGFRYRNPNAMTRQEIRNLYRSRKHRAIGRFTIKQFTALCVLYGEKCLCCGSTDKKLHADHIVALSRGGDNGLWNIQPLCETCNRKKITKSTDYRIDKDAWRLC